VKIYHLRLPSHERIIGSCYSDVKASTTTFSYF
jgi:hypothetical protein